MRGTIAISGFAVYDLHLGISKLVNGNSAIGACAMNPPAAGANFRYGADYDRTVAQKGTVSKEREHVEGRYQWNGKESDEIPRILHQNSFPRLCILQKGQDPIAHFTTSRRTRNSRRTLAYLFMRTGLGAAVNVTWPSVRTVCADFMEEAIAFVVVLYGQSYH